MDGLPKQYIKQLLGSFNAIDNKRKAKLKKLATLIHSQILHHGESRVNFICTHNSRRSQLCELWLRAACLYFDLPHIHTFSGGTESTAFNHRMVAAIQAKALPLHKLSVNDNPLFTLDEMNLSPLMFSKKYDDKNNPQDNFIAVMVCDDADENCPIVKGAEHRFSLQFVDPKYADNTEKEMDVYKAKVDEIGIEIMFLVDQISQLSP